LSPKEILLSAVATREVDAAFEHYMEQAGADVADAFMDALSTAYRHIALHPGTGSPRYALKLDLPGLRSWPVGRFPYLVFYFEMPGYIDVVRVMHGAMDISQSSMNVQEPGAEYIVDAGPEWDVR
jgi:toxin ParE1/3/4